MIKLKNLFNEQFWVNSDEVAASDKIVFLQKLQQKFNSFQTYYSQAEIVWQPEFSVANIDYSKRASKKYTIPVLLVHSQQTPRICIVDTNGNVLISTNFDNNNETQIYKGKINSNLNSATIYNTNNAGAMQFSIQDVLYNRNQFKNQSVNTINPQRATEIAKLFKKSFVQTDPNNPIISTISGTNERLLGNLVKQIKTAADIITVNDAFNKLYKKSVMWWIKEEGNIDLLWGHAWKEGIISATKYYKQRNSPEQMYAELKNIKMN
jgi:hypothetical protein